jgi:hypothetical protein
MIESIGMSPTSPATPRSITIGLPVADVAVSKALLHGDRL